VLFQMSSAKPTKKDLETKIAELEEKLTKLANQLEAKPVTTTPPPAPKPAPTTAPPPAPKPAPPPAPKPAAQAPPPKPEAKPATELAVWEQWKLAPMTDVHVYKAKVPGYTPSANRYYASLHTTNVDVPTSDWNLQKAKITGYTQPSNKYFATRQRLAHHPVSKTFTGYGIKATGTAAQATTAPPPKPTPAPEPKPATQSSETEAQQKSRKAQLEAYEKEYLERVQQAEKQREEKPVPTPAGSTKGSLPKGFEPKPVEAPKPKPSTGSMPKGWKPS
jgi:hypothetical protein